jgi:hypothetical protein
LSLAVRKIEKKGKERKDFDRMLVRLNNSIIQA